MLPEPVPVNKAVEVLARLRERKDIYQSLMGTRENRLETMWQNAMARSLAEQVDREVRGLRRVDKVMVDELEKRPEFVCPCGDCHPYIDTKGIAVLTSDYKSYVAEVKRVYEETPLEVILEHSASDETDFPF